MLCPIVLVQKILTTISGRNVSYLALWPVSDEIIRFRVWDFLCPVSVEITRDRGWDFLVQQQYITIDTFSRFFVFFKVLYEVCQFRIFFKDFFAFVTI